MGNGNDLSICRKQTQIFNIKTQVKELMIDWSWNSRHLWIVKAKTIIFPERILLPKDRIRLVCGLGEPSGKGKWRKARVEKKKQTLSWVRGKNDSLKFILESWFCYLILDLGYFGKIQKSWDRKLVSIYKVFGWLCK